MTFQLSPQAEESLESIWDYYAELGGERLANRILGDIHDGIHRILTLPTIGHFREDLTDKSFRFYRVHRYFLVYDATASPLYIARIYHSAQNIQALLKRD